MRLGTLGHLRLVNLHITQASTGDTDSYSHSPNIFASPKNG